MAMRIPRYSSAQNPYPSLHSTQKSLPPSNFQKEQGDKLSLNLHQVKHQNSLKFSGNEHYEENGLTKATAMFREAPYLEWVSDILGYLVSHSGVNNFSIADYGCSSGEEAYSLSMLLKDQGVKYELTGYDFAGPALHHAQQGKIGINNKAEFLRTHPNTLVNTNSDPIAIALSTIFRHQHAQFEDEFLNADSASKVRSEPQRKHYRLFHKYFKKQPNESSPDRTIYVLRPDQKLNCNFEAGDIRNILSTRGQNSTDVLLFRNALYHLITESRTTQDEDGKVVAKRYPLNTTQTKLILDNLFRQFNKVLKPGALLVLGPKEHRQHYQQGLVDQALKDAGFEQIEKGQPLYKKLRSI